MKTFAACKQAILDAARSQKRNRLREEEEKRPETLGYEREKHRYRWVWTFGPSPLERIVGGETYYADFEAKSAGCRAAQIYRCFNWDTIRNWGKVEAVEVGS